jgi:hypothetical protein
MKNILILIAFLFSHHALTAPPMGISGQNQTNKYPVVIKVPNNQITDLGSATVLIDNCGSSNNILENCGFEHSTYSTGWTVGGTATASANTSTTYISSGAKSLKFTASSQTLTLTQDSTLYAAGWSAGAQGVLLVDIWSTHNADITICPRSAGTTLTTGCKTVDGPMRSGGLNTIALPIILGATSNGISVSGASGTGDTYVDNVRVEQNSLTSSSGAISAWASYTPTFTGFGTATSTEFQWRQVGSNIEIRGKFTSGTTTAVEPRITLPSGYTSSPIGTIPSVQIVGQGQRSTANAAFFSVQPLIEPSVGYLTFGVQTSVRGGTSKLVASSSDISSGDTISFFASVPVAQLANSVNMFSSSCGAECVDTFSAKVSSAGVVSGEEIDWINGSASVTDTSLYTFTFNSGIFSVAPNCWTTPDATSASLTERNVSVDNATISSSSVAVRTVNYLSSKSTSAFNLFCKKTGADFTASRTIQGSFKEIPTTRGSSGSDLQSVYFGSGGSCTSACSTGSCTICQQSGNKITSVTWNATGNYRINGLDGTKYFCLGTGNNAGYNAGIHVQSSSTSAYADTIWGQGVTAANTAGASVVCIGTP